LSLPQTTGRCFIIDVGSSMVMLDITLLWEV